MQYSPGCEGHLEILASAGFSTEQEKQEAGLAPLSSQGAELDGGAILAWPSAIRSHSLGSSESLLDFLLWSTWLSRSMHHPPKSVVRSASVSAQFAIRVEVGALSMEAARSLARRISSPETNSIR